MRDRIIDLVEVPPLFDAEAKEVLEIVSDRYRLSTTDSTLSIELLSLDTSSVAPLSSSISSTDDWISFGEVTSGKVTDSLEEEVRACFANLEGSSLRSAYLGQPLTTCTFSSAGYRLSNITLDFSFNDLSFAIVDDPLPRHQRHLYQILWILSSDTGLRRRYHAKQRTSNQAGRNCSTREFISKIVACTEY